jgi:hypothetical protein
MQNTVSGLSPKDELKHLFVFAKIAHQIDSQQKSSGSVEADE